MEKRQEIYELQDVPNPSCGSEPHASLTAAKWSQLTYTNTDPHSNDYEQHDAKTERTSRSRNLHSSTPGQRMAEAKEWGTPACCAVSSNWA